MLICLEKVNHKHEQIGNFSKTLTMQKKWNKNSGTKKYNIEYEN